MQTTTIIFTFPTIVLVFTATSLVVAILFRKAIEANKIQALIDEIMSHRLLRGLEEVDRETAKLLIKDHHIFKTVCQAKIDNDEDAIDFYIDVLADYVISHLAAVE